jgi:hypothetical protein
MQESDQMIISGQNPAKPNTNCLWVTLRGADWYLGTWLPSAYHVLVPECIHEICESIFRSSSTAIYTIDPQLTGRHKLRRLSDEEIEELGFV